jgi:hypothetical protein
MDLIVAQAGDGKGWTLTDLLGRSMGQVTEGDNQKYTVEPAGHALEPMKGLKLGPYASLDDALDAIERHTRGVCRRTAAETND